MLISIIYSRGSKSKTVVGSAEKHSVISTELGGTWGAQRKKGVGKQQGRRWSHDWHLSLSQRRSMSYWDKRRKSSCLKISRGKVGVSLLLSKGNTKIVVGDENLQLDRCSFRASLHVTWACWEPTGPRLGLPCLLAHFCAFSHGTTQVWLKRRLCKKIEEITKSCLRQTQQSRSTTSCKP